MEASHPSSTPFLIHISRITRVHSEHLTTIHGALVIAISATYPRYTADTRLIVVEPEFTTRASVKATSTTDVARVITRGELVPLQGLQSWVLRKQGRGKNEITRRLTVDARDAGHNKWLGNRLQVSGGLLLVLLLFGIDAVTLLGFFVEKWLDADTTCFGPEMAAERVCTCESTATAPMAAS